MSIEPPRYIVLEEGLNVFRWYVQVPASMFSFFLEKEMEINRTLNSLFAFLLPELKYVRCPAPSLE
jgi:hypothetical protein